MRVCLDTRDLIDLLETRPSHLSHVDALLRTGGHRLVVSFTTVLELSAPLAHPEQSNVMRLLNQLEALPVIFVNEARIGRQELGAAADAFREGREYSAVDPFVSRFDQTLDLDATPPTRSYLRYSLAETIFDLWQTAPDLWSGNSHRFPLLRERLTSDRAKANPPTLKAHFPTVIARNLSLYGIRVPVESTAPLARWIYADPQRCAGSRLIFEVYHHIRRNEGDRGHASDLGDFAQIPILPYVDVITLDRRMRTYVGQACSSLGTDYGTIVLKGIRDLEDLLATTSDCPAA